MEVFERAARKAALLGRVDTEWIFGTLEDEWKDAKEFFISAVKVGFSSGEVQIWKTIELQQIGSRVVSSLVSSMLLNIEHNPHLYDYLGSAEDHLEHELRTISQGKIDTHMIKNSICQLERGVETEDQLFSLVRILNLFVIADELNEYSLNFVISSLLQVSVQPRPLVERVIENCVRKVNGLLGKAVKKEYAFIK